MSPLRLYTRYVGVSLRSQLAYRASFLMHAAGHLLVTGLEFLGIWALFARFGSLQGWTLPEVCMTYGMIGVAFALAEAIPRGFDIFPQWVKAGTFDRILLRPRTTVLQICGAELQLMRIGRLTQAAAVLGYGIATLGIAWTIPKMLLLGAAILGGACAFSGLFILGATLAFWTIESLELVNITTYGGVEAAQFPISIYAPWLRVAFTFVVPLAATNYYPLQAILARPDPLGTPGWFAWASPALGVAFLAVALGVWTVGVRKYQSTGS